MHSFHIDKQAFGIHIVNQKSLISKRETRIIELDSCQVIVEAHGELEMFCAAHNAPLQDPPPFRQQHPQQMQQALLPCKCREDKRNIDTQPC